MSVSDFQIDVDTPSLAGHEMAVMPKNPRSTPNSGRSDATRAIEVVAFPAVQMLDVTGPLQVFASANDIVVERGGAPPPALPGVAEGVWQLTAPASIAVSTYDQHSVLATLLIPKV